jgi:hypothetical protein
VFALLKEGESDVLFTEDITFENLGFFIAELRLGRVVPFLSYGPPGPSSAGEDDYYVDEYGDDEAAQDDKRPSSQKDEL